MTRLQNRDNLGRLLSPAMRRALLAFVIVALTLAVYAPVKQHPFIHIDDYGYVVNNFHIQHLNWDTVTWSFTTFHYANWDPLTWLSHALDIHFFGLDPGRHHETSLLLHALDALLLFWLLWQATGYVGRSFAAAALFALHPCNVEAVAWVAERKTVLSMVFFLLTLMTYRWYARQPAVSRYLVVAMLFALGLMSKPQIITLPFVLLLWDYWPLGRMFPSGSSPLAGETPGHVVPGKSLSWLLLEKLPLLALSAGSAVSYDESAVGESHPGRREHVFLCGSHEQRHPHLCAIPRPCLLAGAPVILLSSRAEYGARRAACRGIAVIAADHRVGARQP
jgi:protein O-mannosyl-transferase